MESMPIYEYRCTNGHKFEEMQRISDEPIQNCNVCQAPVERVFHPVAIHFKGSGFYNTDYGKQRRGGDRGSSESESSSQKDDSKQSESGSSKAESSKSETKSKAKESSNSTS